jgi:hypothetical protein
MRLSISGPLMLAGAGSQPSTPLKNAGGFMILEVVLE